MRCYNIEKIYNKDKENKNQALTDININFKNSGLVCIIGKSGSGKSSLLSILALLDHPTDGKVSDGNLCLTELSAKEANQYRRNNIGFIFQNYNLINELTLVENITLGFKNVNSENLDPILDLLEIKKYANTQVTELSGGEQQRVAIARALFKESKVIIADEPTGNLDETNSRIIFETLQKVSKERLVIVVTHDKQSANQYAERVITISDGKVIEDTSQLIEEEPIGCNLSAFDHGTINNSTALKLSWKLMKTRKIRLFISVMLLALSLSLFGLFILFTQYDLKEITPNIFLKSEDSLIKIRKGYVDKQSGKFIQSNRTIMENEFNDFIQKNQIEDYDRTYMLLGMLLTTSSTGNIFFPQQVPEAIVSTKEGMSKYGFQISYGKYPESEDQVAITDFLAYCISVLQPNLISEQLGISNLYEIEDDNVLTKGLEQLEVNQLISLFGDGWKDSIKNKETLDRIRENPGILLLDSKVDFINNELKINAILETGFEEKYKDLIYMNEVALNDDERSGEFKYLVNTYYSQFYVDDSFIENVYPNKILFTNTAFCKYSYVKNYLKLDQELKGTEAYISNNLFRYYFKQEFDMKKVDTYEIPNTTTRPLGPGMKPDLIFTSEPLNLKGVFELPAGYGEVLNHSSAIVVSDEYFENFSKAQCYIDSINISVPRRVDEQKRLMNYLEAHELYFVTDYSSVLYELSNFIKIFRKVFIGLLIVMITFSFVFISSFFHSIISDQKREIGIMRAIGLKKSEISKIFLMGGGLISLLSIVLTFLLLFILQRIGNSLIVNEFNKFNNDMVINGLEVLILNFIPFILIICTCILISSVSMIYPIRKMSNMDPAEVIRG